MFFIDQRSPSVLRIELEDSIINCLNHLLEGRLIITNYAKCSELLEKTIEASESFIRSVGLIPEIFINDFSNYYIEDYFLNVNRRECSDRILVINADNLRFQTMKNLAGLGYKIFLWNIDDPYWIDMTIEKVPYCRAVFTVEESVIDVYKTTCPNVFYLPLAYDDVKFGGQIAGEVEGKYKSDICFIGSPFGGSVRNQVIIETVKKFSKKNRINIIGTHVEGEKWSQYLGDQKEAQLKVIDNFIDRPNSLKYIRGAAINLNFHRDSFGTFLTYNSNKLKAISPNERCFFIGGAGGFQIVDDSRPGLAKIFEPGKELVTFGNLNDLFEKIEYYLKHPQERENIARAGQKKVLEKHTFKNRISEMLEIIKKVS